MKKEVEDAAALGRKMWMMLANTFIETLDGNGITDADVRTAAWAALQATP